MKWNKLSLKLQILASIFVSIRSSILMYLPSMRWGKYNQNKRTKKWKKLKTKTCDKENIKKNQNK